jgi:integrase
MRVIHPTKAGQRLGMPVAAWPEHDQAAWQAAFQPTRLLRGRPHGGKLRPPTRTALENAYARGLLWVKTHFPDELALPLGARATEDRVISYLETVAEEVAPITAVSYAERLKRALGLLAFEDDWFWFDPLIRELRQQVKAAPSARRPFVPTDQLFAFGVEIMRAAEADATLSDVAQAETHRDGLMIAFLAARPLRLKNMTQLAKGTQLTATKDGYDIALAGGDMKAKAPLEFALPQELVAPMTRYLAHYRKVLSAGPHGAAAGYPDQEKFVWLARSGAMFPQDTFATMIAERMRERFGIEFRPHDFRRCAATTIAETNPEDYHIIRIILGHSTMATAERHYIHAKGREAVRRYQAVVDKTRKTLAKKAGGPSTGPEP